MKDLNNNEKYIYLASSFPVDSYKPGHIDNLPDLGNDSVSVKFVQ